MGHNVVCNRMNIVLAQKIRFFGLKCVFMHYLFVNNLKEKCKSDKCFFLLSICVLNFLVKNYRPKSKI